MYGYKQRRLPLDEENLLEGLCEQFPQAQRDQVIAHYGRWIAAARSFSTFSPRLSSRRVCESCLRDSFTDTPTGRALVPLSQ